MAFINQKAEILDFYNKTNEVVQQHKETYSKLVTKLNEKTGLTQNLNNNLDSFMEHSFKEFSDYKQEIEKNDLDDSIISHVYDINKNDYITNFTLPDKKVVAKQNFKCVLMENKKEMFVTQNGRPCNNRVNKPFTSSQISNSTYTNRTHLHSNNCIIETKQSIPIKKECNCGTHCGCGSSQNLHYEIVNLFKESSVYCKKDTKDLEFWIDDYFNIYIPSLKTYLVFNYSKFPLYSFYINMDKLNLYHNHIESGVRSIMFNEDCPEDLKEFELFKTFVEPSSDFSTSKDKRNQFKVLFKNLLTFYKYTEKQDFFSQYHSLSEKMEQLSPTKLVLSGNDDTMNDEMKIFSQSKRIRELEIVNQKQSEEIDYLREERTKYIEKEHLSNDKIMSYQKLLEELNTQLHQEIDNVSNKQKEILRLKNEILETSSIKAEYRQLEDKHSSVKQQLSKTEESLSKLKTLNSTMVDKQLESQQKLVAERNQNKENLDIIKNLKLEITSYDDKIKELESNIESETEQNSINKNKIDELISNMNSSSTTSNTDDQYQEMLLSQLKEKKEEIESMKLQNTKLESDVKNSEDKYCSLKAQVSALFNN